MVARRFSTTSVTMYQSTPCTHPRRQHCCENLTSHSDDSFTCHPLPAICRRHSDNFRVAVFLFSAYRNDLSSRSQRRNCTFSCTAAPVTSARTVTISGFYNATVEDLGLTGSDAASFGVSLHFERTYCLHLQGLMCPRRLTSIKTPRNNNNPETNRHIPADMNAQVKPYPILP